MTPEQQKAIAIAKARARMSGGYGEKIDVDAIESDPTRGMSGPQRFAAGAGKAFTDVGRGVKQTALEAMTVGQPSQRPGIPATPAQQRLSDYNAQLEESRRLDAPLMKTGAGLSGNIAGNVAAFAPTAFIPGAGTYKGASLIGAGIGALMPTTVNEDRLTNALTGAAGGAIGRGAAGGISRVLAPRSSPQVQTLMREGVTPPPGQVLGGQFARTEEAATSIPFVGEAIKGAQKRGIEDFNRAAFNRVLAPLGKKITNIGREGLDEVDDAIKAAYDDALTGTSIRVDNQFIDDLTKVGREADNLLPDAGKKLNDVISKKVLPRIGDKAEVSGETFKVLDSELGKFSRAYKGSPDPEIRELGDIVDGIKLALRNTVERQASPEAAASLKAANSAYMNMLSLQKAVGTQGAEGGVFTPKQLKSAIRSLDPSLRKGQFARGRSPMQDLAEAGEAVLSQRVPDSGTALRTMTGAGLLGGAAYLDPMYAVGGAGLAGLYTRPAQNVMSRLLTQRPESIAQIGRGVQRLTPLSAALSSPAIARESE